MDKKIKIIFVVFIITVIAISAGIFIFYYKNTLGLEFNEIKKDSAYFSGVLEEKKINFWINNQGNAGNVLYFPRGKTIEIELDYSTEGLPIDPSRIEAIIIHANEKKEILPINFSKPYNSTFEYSASYTGNQVGSDKVEVAIKDSQIKYTSKINFYDNSFVIESDIDVEDVFFQAGNLFSIANKSVEPPKFIDGFAEGLFDGFETPGKVQYLFVPKSKNKTNDKAMLDVYVLAPSIKELYSSEFVSNYVPAYLSNLKQLDNLLKQDFKDISGDMVPDFPPVNASRGGTYDIKILNFKGGKGVRFLVPGYFQAVGSAKQPAYVFQGITDDRKHHIVFRYNDLFSRNLEKELKNDPGFKDNEKWIQNTFKAVEFQGEKEFVPGVDKLDTFIESLEINS